MRTIPIRPSQPFAAAGVLEGNPIHEDMIYAARRVNVQFILNVALNARKEIIAAFAGDVEAAHLEGCRYIRSISEEPAVTGDIVVTSNGGYPLDQNLYQSPKAVATAEACAGEDGVIIMVCACREGIGGSHFEELIMGRKSAGDRPEAVRGAAPGDDPGTVVRPDIRQDSAKASGDPGDHVSGPGGGTAGQHDSGVHAG